MSYTIEFVCKRSMRRIKCEPYPIAYSSEEEALQEAIIAARKKSVELMKRVAARVVAV